MGHRRPYRPRSDPPAGALATPSEVLARNLRDYRLLRDMTQSDLAAHMSGLGHGWSRSTVSAVEGTGRNITVDELGGLAISLGTSIGQLLDPTGPDHSRKLSVDVGLPGLGGSLRPELGHLWSLSRLVVSLGDGEGVPLAFGEAPESPFDSGVGEGPVRPELFTRRNG